MAQTRRISADDWNIIATALGGDVAENLKTAILEWDAPDKHGDNMRLARALKAVHQKIEAGIKYYRKTMHENRIDPPRRRQVTDDGVGYTWVPEIPPTDIYAVDIPAVIEFAPQCDWPDLYQTQVDTEAVQRLAPPSEHPEYYRHTVIPERVEIYYPRSGNPNLYRWEGRKGGRKGYMQAVVLKKNT